MTSLRLYKNEKLCSVTAISQLFSRDASNFTTAAFPIRAFWRDNPNRASEAPMQFLVSVPKKRLRHAVDRVKMRRRIRESYRLNHQNHPLPEGMKIDVIFVYIDSKLHSYGRINKSMIRILDSISRQANERMQAPQ